MGRLLAKAYRNIGYNLEGSRYPSLRALAMANQSEVDGELARIEQVTEAYTGLTKVSEPLIELYSAAYTLPTKPSSTGQKCSRATIYRPCKPTRCK